MKGKNLILVGLIGAAVGLILILFRNSLASGGVVTCGGILFVVAGLLNMLVFLGSRDKQGRSKMGLFGTAFGWIASAAAVVLGLAMLIFKGAFVAMVGFMFAVLLLFAALFQLGLLLYGAKPARIPNWFFLVPIALICAAIYIFVRKPDEPGEIWDLIFTGSSFILFGIATVAEGFIIGHNNRKIRKQAKLDESGKPEALPADTKGEAEKPADRTEA